MIQRIGAWSDRTALSRPEEYAARAEDLGLTDVSLFVTSLRDRAFKLIRSVATVERAVRAFQRRGIAVHLSTWVRPHRAYLTPLAATLAPLCQDLGVVTLDLDTESAWRSKGRAHKAMADFLFDGLSNRGLTIPVGVNDYASLQRCTRPLLDRADIARPQLYSVEYVRHGKVGSDGRAWTTPESVYWPGRTQRYGMAMRLWGSYLGARQFVAGLAAYHQAWRRYPEMSAEDAMRMCFDSAQDLGAEAVWYWSLQSMTGEVARIIRALARDVRSMAIASDSAESVPYYTRGPKGLQTTVQDE